MTALGKHVYIVTSHVHSRVAALLQAVHAETVYFSSFLTAFAEPNWWTPSRPARKPLHWGVHVTAQANDLRAQGSKVETIFPDAASQSALGTGMNMKKH
jgi:hypothetical protein